MPEVNDRFTYRNIDVSIFKELIARWYPDVEMPEKQNATHRVMGDIQNSIDLLKWVRENMFPEDKTEGAAMKWLKKALGRR